MSNLKSITKGRKVYKYLSPDAVNIHEPLDEKKEIRIALQENPRKCKEFFFSPESLKPAIPESLVSTYKPTKSDDVYMFGNLLWQFISKKKPFAPETVGAAVGYWLNKGIREEIPAHWGTDYVQIIDKCWRPVSERPDMTEILQDLDNLLRKLLLDLTLTLKD